MIERIKLNTKKGGNYFSAPKDDIDFIPSGSKILDLCLGGGWAERRISNIVGDKSSGKTLLCIEAAANFAIKYTKGKIRYREAEAAFQRDYAQALGMPIDRVDFGDRYLETVEDLFEDLEYCATHAKQPELYICDSLDALSDRSELKREMDEGSYGTAKAKKMSELFRRVVRKLEEANITLIIVSQVRDKIGVTFGRKTTRTGGRALDFYASQALYLAQIGTISKVVRGIKRPIGVKVKAKVDKNKVALPFRDGTFDILFGYGVDDVGSCVDWMKEAKFLKDLGINSDKDKVNYIQEVRAKRGVGLSKLHRVVEDRWYEIENSFLPKQGKYSHAANN